MPNKPLNGTAYRRPLAWAFENENNVSRKGAKSAKIDENIIGKGIKENSAIFAAWRETEPSGQRIARIPKTDFKP